MHGGQNHPRPDVCHLKVAEAMLAAASSQAFESNASHPLHAEVPVAGLELLLPEGRVDALVQKGAQRRWFEASSWMVPPLSRAAVNVSKSGEAVRRRPTRVAARVAALVGQNQAEQHAVIWLHGILPTMMAAFGQDSGRSVALPGLPQGTEEERPQAPQMSITWLDGASGYAWFDVSEKTDFHELTTDRTASTLAAAMAIVDGLIDSKLKEGVPARNVVVGGFSNGAALALHMALHSRHRCELAGALVWSGYPFNFSKPSWDGCNRRPPVRLMHGEDDDLVPYEWGKAAAEHARSCGIKDVELTTFGDGITHLAALSYESLQTQAGVMVHDMMTSAS